MLGDITKLFELAIRLLNRNSELDKDYYEQFIVPIWEAFVRVHENYKLSFVQYEHQISTGEIQISSLIDGIKRDSIYTSDLRVELRQMITHLPSNRDYRKLSTFADSISHYFSEFDPRSSLPPSNLPGGAAISIDSTDAFIDFSSNVVRMSAVRSLKSLNEYQESLDNSDSSEAKVSLAREAIEVIFDRLQGRYVEVSRAYHRLRGSLLT